MTFTVLIKINSFCNTKVIGLEEIFLPRKVSDIPLLHYRGKSKTTILVVRREANNSNRVVAISLKKMG